MKSGSAAFFFGGGDDFGRSFAATSPASFSCESAVCSRVESWGRNWNRSRSPWLAEASSIEDLKHAMKSNLERIYLRKKFDGKDLRCIEAEVQKGSLSRSRRRTTVQRLGVNCSVIIITRRKVGIAEIF
jgi:hypothetical protein